MCSMFLIAIVVHVLPATATGYAYDMPFTQSFPSMEVPSIDYSRIVGGTATTIDKFPYQLSLQIKRLLVSNHICGASIISQEWAISAAHCFYGYQTEVAYLRAGSSYYSNGGQIHTLAQIIIHENYQHYSPTFDIALVKVNEPFIFSNWVQPIPLETGEIYPGTMAVITGWGYTQGGSPLAEQLQMVSLPIITNEECRRVYGGVISNDNICAGFGNAVMSVCRGDSGGPLAVNGKLAGIVSGGDGCSTRPELPGVYTKVSLYRYWIRQHSGV